MRFSPRVEEMERRLVPANPIILSITRSAPAKADTNATTVAFAVTFSEAVTGVDPTDFTVKSTGTVGSTSIQVAGSGSSYTLSVGGISGDGTLAIQVINNGSIRNLGGMALVTTSNTAAF